MNGDLQCRWNVTNPSGGISVSGSMPDMCRAKPRTTVIRRDHTELAGSASGRRTQTRAASTVILEAPSESRKATKRGNNRWASSS